MNLYKLHTKPNSLDLHDEAHDRFPKLCWDTYRKRPKELKKREAAIAKDPEYAYKYARDVIKGRFPAGEAVISKNPYWAFQYAKYVIKGRWPEAEATLAKDPAHAFAYSKFVIKGRWPEGEAAIARAGKELRLSYKKFAKVAL